MSLLSVKIIAALAILAVGVIGGAVPIVARRWEGSRRLFSLGNAFAGGIFLGAALIHLLPDGTEKLEGVSDYPIAGLLAALGLALLLLINRILFSHPGVEGNARSKTAPYVLTVVLSVHSIVAGISLGLETHVSTTIVILLAILFHKGFAAFALIVSAHKADMPVGTQKSILAAFVTMTPLGLFLGSVASALLISDTATLMEGSFDALAAGTFLYIAVLDIIDKELAGEEDKLAKFGLIVSGIIFMAVLAIWT